MTVFVLATHNAHKVDELRRILGERLGHHELIGYDGPEPVEDADTFEGNALIKARAAAVFTGLPAIADDSGICVDALGGAPGIHSARYAGTRDDGDNYRLLLKNLDGVADRAAQFVCAAALVDVGALDAGPIPTGLQSSDGGFEHTERGTWPGSVLEAPAGSGGFGYDPIFRPDGLEVSSAELTADEKNAVSHRAMAFGLLVAALRARYG
ncbi:MAG TPA: RdgB/HAM1 family non-canonical purine NTP pyrophosphatase [Pseudolysinimonas sp.]|nr:RdgB/HAM1 family non-canonical purine NTP pyrophosphatase [Pseudolysinimonas sp.]